MILQDDGPFENNPHYVRLKPTGHRWKHTGLQNEGFFGVGLRKGASYRFSVWARLPEGGESQKISIELGNSSSDEWGQAYAKSELVIDSKEWKKYEVELQSPVSDPEAFPSDFPGICRNCRLGTCVSFPCGYLERASERAEKGFGTGTC